MINNLELNYLIEILIILGDSFSYPAHFLWHYTAATVAVSDCMKTKGVMHILCHNKIHVYISDVSFC